MLIHSDLIDTLERQFGTGLDRIERGQRWFILSALAFKLFNDKPFAQIVSTLDPDNLISEEVKALLYAMDYCSAQEIWALKQQIVFCLVEEFKPSTSACIHSRCF